MSSPLRPILLNQVESKFAKKLGLGERRPRQLPGSTRSSMRTYATPEEQDQIREHRRKLLEAFNERKRAWNVQYHRLRKRGQLPVPSRARELSAHLQQRISDAAAERMALGYSLAEALAWAREAYAPRGGWRAMPEPRLSRESQRAMAEEMAHRRNEAECSISYGPGGVA